MGEAESASSKDAAGSGGAILLFTGVVYGLSVALGLLVGLTGGPASPFIGYGVVAMAFPAIAVLVVRTTRGEKVATLGWRRFPIGYALLALLLIPIVMHVVMLPATAAISGGIPWQPWLTPGSDGLFHSPDERGWGAMTANELAGRIAINALIGVIVVSLLAFFEEIGWRAWLLPRLAARLGESQAIIVGALLWAFWHTPFALSGIHTLEGVPTIATMLILPVGHVGAGMIIGWLWMRTTSIWIVMLAHGALNNWGQYVFKYMSDLGGSAAWILLAGNLGLLLTGLFLAMRHGRRAN